MRSCLRGIIEALSLRWNELYQEGKAYLLIGHHLNINLFEVKKVVLLYVKLHWVIVRCRELEGVG